MIYYDTHNTLIECSDSDQDRRHSRGSWTTGRSTRSGYHVYHTISPILPQRTSTRGRSTRSGYHVYHTISPILPQRTQTLCRSTNLKLKDLERQSHKILAYDKIFCSTSKEFSFHRTLRRAAGFLSKYQYCSPLKETRPSPLVDHYHSLSSRTYFFLSSVEKLVPSYVDQYHS